MNLEGIRRRLCQWRHRRRRGFQLGGTPDDANDRGGGERRGSGVDDDGGGYAL